MSHLTKSAALALAMLIAGSGAALAGKATTLTTTQPPGQQTATATVLTDGLLIAPNVPGQTQSAYINSLLDILRNGQ